MGTEFWFSSHLLTIRSRINEYTKQCTHTGTGKRKGGLNGRLSVNNYIVGV